MKAIPWRIIAGAVAGLVLLASPWWGTAVLRRMDFFRVRKVQIVGARYLVPGEIVSALNVDTLASVWDDVAPLERRVAAMPLVKTVKIGRSLPATLVVTVTEKTPLALVPAAKGMTPVDVTGQLLPIDPSVAEVDVPVLAAADRGALQLLDAVRTGYPALFAQLSEVRPLKQELFLVVGDTPVHAPRDVSADRLALVLPVQDDLARRHAHAAELDLRYRDQVIARLP